MNFGAEDTSDEEISDINVIPLIDVLLVLLIFFMASASFVASGGLDVKLPSASAPMRDTPAEKLIITINEKGEFSVAGQVMTLETLRALFDAQSALAVKPVLVVRADQKVDHGTVVQVLDEAKKRGIDEIAIAAMLNR